MLHTQDVQPWVLKEGDRVIEKAVGFLCASQVICGDSPGTHVGGPEGCVRIGEPLGDPTEGTGRAVMAPVWALGFVCSEASLRNGPSPLENDTHLACRVTVTIRSAGFYFEIGGLSASSVS